MYAPMRFHLPLWPKTKISAPLSETVVDRPCFLKTSEIELPIVFASILSVFNTKCRRRFNSQFLEALSFGLTMYNHAEGNRSIDARTMFKDRIRRRKLKYQ